MDLAVHFLRKKLWSLTSPASRKSFFPDIKKDLHARGI
jgi:hypothetical protein